MRTLLLLAALSLPAISSMEAADTEAAALARTRQLKTKVSLDASEMPLIDFLKAVAEECEKQLSKPPKWTYTPEVTPTQKVTYRCKDKPIEDVLADVLKGPGYGYVVVSGEADRHDGFIRITKGDERGFAKGAEPTPEDRAALAKLERARELIKEGKKIPAKAVLRLFLKEYENTPYAAEAMKLLAEVEK